MSTRHIALVTDVNYVPWCATAVRSIARHGGLGPTVVHVVHDGSVLGDDTALLERAALDEVGLRFHAIDGSDIGHLPALGRFGSIVWARFLLPRLLGDLDRVLYMDADVLVADELTELVDAPLGGAPIGAVRNVLPAATWPRVQQMGLVDPADYFNSGVLLLDLEQLRGEDLLERCADVVGALGSRLVWPDQDALNVLFAGRWRPLEPRFNAQQSFFVWPELAKATIGMEAWRDATTHPAVVHFEGPDINKPWNVWSNHPYRASYREVMAEVGSPRAALEGDGLAARATRVLGADTRFRLFRTTRSWRANPRAEARRQLRTLRARVGEGEPTSESWVPSDHGARLRPSKQVPHPLATATGTHADIVRRCRPFTMVSDERLLATIDGVEQTIAADVAGDFAECGVWRGGSTLAIVLTLLARGVADRDVWLYDTFEGMTPPTAHDTSRFEDRAIDSWQRSEASGERVFGDVFADHSFGVGQVRRLLASTGYPAERLHFVQGPVEQTIPAEAPSKLAFLRLDTDWYESTKHELEHLYPRLEQGGILVIDDYGHWDGARQAVEEYFSTEPRPFLTRSDYSGRIGSKP